MAFTQAQIDNAENVYALMVQSVRHGDDSVTYDDVAAQERKIAHMKANLAGSSTVIRQIQVRVDSGY